MNTLEAIKERRSIRQFTDEPIGKDALETILEDGLMDRAGVIHEQIHAAVDSLVKGVRGRGCLIGLELDGPAKPVLAALREAGVLAGGSGHPNVIRLMPPLIARV